MESDLSNAEIVVIAAYLSGGASEVVDIEDIADSAFEIAPSRFCWKRHADRIDLRTVQYSLKDAAKVSPALITGNLRSGYQTTPTGTNWAQEILSHGTLSVGGARHHSAADFLETERARLRGTAACSKMSADPQCVLDRRDFEQFVRVNDYFPRALRQQRFRRIENVISGERLLTEVWARLKQQFGETEDE